MSGILESVRDQSESDVSQGSVGVSPLGLNLQERAAAIDEERLNRDRLARLRVELSKRGYAGALFSDPINIRYATGTRNMAVWTMHAPGRYAFVGTDGPVVLFEFGSTLHVSRNSSCVDEIRVSTPWFHFLAGCRVQEKTETWATQVIDLLAGYDRSNRRLAVDRCEPWGAQLLIEAGIQLFDAQEAIEHARTIKTPDEILCMQLSVDVADVAIDRMRRALVPGITENQLWSILHETNIAHGGEWIECRLLASGERTNPWFQESSNRLIQAGDIVAFDTDMVGPFGYLADISRSFVCPGRRPTSTQRQLYETAQRQVLTNMELIRPGMEFREFAARCWPMPEEYIPNRYMMTVHGAGMVDEYPSVALMTDWEEWGIDGRFEENMVVCVESFIGKPGAKEGVKLEQQALITRSGAVPMSSTPLIDAIEA
ncbi:M24 family metallopeptidase [Steroidobacter flavus]|uniref:M24 family metallopeptidase n=1 Tax=Steroidobacter flavus TaxID=1842136 RepID=A0ABV8SWR4_9GAMM